MTDGPRITLDRETFKVLASDTRLDILKALDVRRKTVTELARELDLNKATIFEHLEKLQGADLVQKVEDERKWVYYQLSWKARRLLHPEAITVALLLSTSLAAIVTAAVSFYLYWRGRVILSSPNPSPEAAADAGPSAAGRSASDAAEFANGAGVVESLVHDPVWMWVGVLLAVLAATLVVAAYTVRARARPA